MRIPADEITAILHQREGMGESGETFLVGEDGLLRTDSLQDPENFSVSQSFAAPGTHKIKTPGVTSALTGKSGKLTYSNHRGVEVLGAWVSISLPGSTWAMVAEEVRNLAQRSSEAITSTSKQIAGTDSRVTEGSDCGDFG